MRAAGQLERAEALLTSSLVQDFSSKSILAASTVPVFFSDFLLDIKHSAVYQAFGNFHTNPTHVGFSAPTFTLKGLCRSSSQSTMVLGRNGAFTMAAEIRTTRIEDEVHGFYVTAIDVLLKRFVEGAQLLYSAAAVPSPVVLGISIANAVKLAPLDRGFVEGPVKERGAQSFPFLQIANMFEPVDRIIRPLCDVVHQAFGKTESPCFKPDGSWRGPV
jgi:hypothetical protein